MKKQTIEVEGLPDGYEVVSVTIDPGSRSYHDKTHIKNTAVVMLEKIKPRRLLLEETAEFRKAVYADWINNNGFIEQWRSSNTSQDTYQIWREVKETDIPLTKDETKLRDCMQSV